MSTTKTAVMGARIPYNFSSSSSEARCSKHHDDRDSSENKVLEESGNRPERFGIRCQTHVDDSETKLDLEPRPTEIETALENATDSSSEDSDGYSSLEYDTDDYGDFYATWSDEEYSKEDMDLLERLDNVQECVLREFRSKKEQFEAACDDYEKHKTSANFNFALLKYRQWCDDDDFEKEGARYYEQLMKDEWTKQDYDDRVRVIENMMNQMYNVARLMNNKAESGVEEIEETKEVNTTFTDQRDTVSDEGYINNSQVAEKGNLQSMQEGEYHVRTVLSKPLVVWTKPWMTSQAVGTQLGALMVPGDLIKGPHYNILSTFTFFRGSVKIRAQLNTVPFNFGRLIIAFCSQYSIGLYTDVLYAVDQLPSMPHIMLDAGMSNSGELSIPFNHFKTYFNLITAHNEDFLGTLLIYVFNKLGSTTGASQTVDLTLWTSFENCEVHQPSYAHNVLLPKSTKTFQLPIAEAGLEGLMKSVLPTVAQIAAPAATGFLGNVTGGASNCDKPTDPIETNHLVPNTVTSLNFGDGLDKSNRLSLQRGTNTLQISEILMTTKDDMDLRQILRIPTRLATFEWKSSFAAGTFINHFPAAATYCAKIATSTIDKNVDVYEPTLIGYVSRAFKYCRGGLHFKFQVIANLMMSGRIQIAFTPSLCTSDFNICNYSNTLILDLQEKHEIEFTVPYMSTRPWLRCDKLFAETTFNDLLMCGGVSIHVINRLTVPDATAQSIDINVFVSAADDFELAVPTDLSFYAGSGNPIPAGTSIAESGLSHVTEREDHTQQIMSYQGTPGLSSAANTLSENAMDLKTLLRRYTKVYENIFHHTGTPSEFNFLFFDNSPNLSGVNKAFGPEDNKEIGIQCRTPLSHFSELFTFWRGSLRYKLVLSTESNVTNFRVFHVPGAFYNSGFIERTPTTQWRKVLAAMESQGVQVATTRIQNSIEFEIPFYSPFTQLRTILTGGTTNAFMATGTICVAFATENSVYAHLYQAGGDDFQLSYLRAAPRIQFETTAEKNRLINNGALGLYDLKFLPLPAVNAPTPKMLQLETVEDQMQQLEIVEDNPNKAEALVDYMPRNPYTVALNAIENFGNTGKAAEGLISGIAKKCGLRTNLADVEDNLSGEDPENEDEPITTLQSFLNAIPGLLNLSVKIGCKVATLVSGFQAYLTAPNKTIKVMAIITIVKELFGGLLDKMVSKLLPLATTIIEIINGSEKLNELPRAEADYLSFVPAIVAVLTTILVFLGFKNIPNDKDTKEIIDNIRTKLQLFNFGTSALKNMKELYHQCKEMIEFIQDQILEWCAPQLLAQLKLQRGFEEIENWAQFVDAMDNETTIDRCNCDPEYRKEVLKMCEKGEHFTRLLVTGKVGKEAGIIRQYNLKCIEWKAKIEKSWHSLPYRKDPYCLCLHGAPGVGKSSLIASLAMDVMDSMNYPLYNRWCAVNPAEEFFTESYNNHTSIYVDDFSMFNSEEQYKTFNSLKSNNTHPLNMAFKKGMKFDSDFIWMTTNTPYPHPNCVTNIEALHRRRDALIECDFTSEDLRQEIVVNKRNELRQKDKSHIRFRVNSSFPGREHRTQWMTYDEMRKWVVEDAQKHMANQQILVAEELKRFGYTDPTKAQGEGGEIILDIDKVMDHPIFMNYSLEMWEQMTWSVQLNKFVLKATCQDEELISEYRDLEVRRTQTEEEYRCNELSDWDKQLNKCKKLSLCETVKKAIYDGMQRLKNYISQKWIEAKAKFSWLRIFETWPAKFAGVFIALAGCLYTGVKILHKCICQTTTRFGYRCHLCGKWPKFENCLNKQWMLKEWQDFYGSEEFRDRTLTLEDEQAYHRMLGMDPPSKIYQGTFAKAQTGPYNDYTRGSGKQQIIANIGPYTDATKGVPKQQIIANVGPYCSYTKGVKPPQILANVDVIPPEEEIEITNVKPIAQAGEMLVQLIQNRLMRALYRVRVMMSNGVMGTNALAIGGRTILIQKHFLDMAEKLGSFEIFHSGAWMKILVDMEKATVIKNKDTVSYEMPIQFHAHKSIIQHFISEKDLGMLKETEALLVSQDGNNIPWLQHTVARAIDESKHVLETDGKYTQYFVRNAWTYRAVTAPGMCGSVLVTKTDKVSGHILGLHVSGIPDGDKFATLITREMIQNHVKMLKLGTPIPLAEGRMTKLVPDGHVGRVGTVDAKKGCFYPTSTTIKPTEIFDQVYEHATIPTALSNNGNEWSGPIEINMMTKGIEKFCEVTKPFSIKHRRMIQNDVRREYEQWVLPRTPAVLSVEESIRGIPELESYLPMKMNTSPGYPYTLGKPAGAVGKAYLFDLENYKIADKEFQRRYDERLAMAKLGERVESTWSCCLKDERRAIEKVKAGKTRLFTIPPADYTLLARQYTLDYTEAVKENRNISHCQVGINCQSLEWNRIYQYLTEFSEDCFAGDFSNFDGCLPPDLTQDFYEDQDYFYKTFSDSYTPQDRNVRMVIADEAIHTVCIAKREIFVTHTGNKSGNPETVIKNSDINDRFMKLAYLGLAEKEGKEVSLAKFHQHVRLITYGDDNVVAVKPEVQEWYNQETVSKFLAEYGIVFTNAQKTGITKIEKVKDVTFLKCGFGQHQEIKGVKVPLMAEQTMRELLNWTRESPEPRKLLCDNINDSLRFAYFYGRAYFKNHRDKITSALNNANLLKGANSVGKILSYDDLDNWFRFTIGQLDFIPKVEAGALETIAGSGNNSFAKTVGKIVQAIPYHILRKTKTLQLKDTTKHTQTRHAFAIPSGEGKSWLCRNYPKVFVDHDDILLPKAAANLHEHGLSYSKIMDIFDEEFDESDRRILLCHHPANTTRKVLGSYMLPKPNYIRANCFQRLRMGDQAEVLDRDERNCKMLNLAMQYEPSLFA